MSTAFLPDVVPTATAGVYFLVCGDRVKIGRANDVERRLRELRTAAAFPLHLVLVMAGGVKEETELHRRFAPLRLHGEWFRFAGALLDFIGERCAARTRVLDRHGFFDMLDEADRHGALGLRIRVGAPQ